MDSKSPRVGDKLIVARKHFQQLLDALSERQYQIIGPTLGEGAIVYDTVTSVEDFPGGWRDEQDGGAYRLKRRDDEALFGYIIGPQSWKKYLHPSTLRLWQASRVNGSFELTETLEEPPKYAFVGVRACELHAIAIQDKVFMHGDYVDPTYRTRREQAFILAVNCGQAGGTCFCSSMNTGPKVTAGFDLALTEILNADRHDFVVEVGTELGLSIVNDVTHTPATPADVELAEQIVAEAATQMGRTLDITNIKELLYRNYEHPQWDIVAGRCLTCANCTMVCPTCFCTTVEDTTDLTGNQAERWRHWDSCFTTDFSYMYGGSVRTTAKSRYRQWMTHKLATWLDQFGTLGCVGCGRCITWCPVGIDITAEVQAIRRTDAAMLASAEGATP